MAAESSLLWHSRSSSSSKPGGRSQPAKQPLKKPKLPVGRFDEPEESSMEKEPLETSPAVLVWLAFLHFRKPQLTKEAPQHVHQQVPPYVPPLAQNVLDP
uniref:succinate dehydrogenase assembly factor 4, mitochondrial isoform X2 n=1 Tax=Agelaius phoeniceus TaxID=39638 RepID=UPI0023ECB4BE|nr:succinate dehydrogenase assembly factor 4, mitochondrial isoform X2 [Agelaius phoeniceus]